MGSDEPVVGNSEVKKLEDRVRELERMLGRKTMEGCCHINLLSVSGVEMVG